MKATKIALLKNAYKQKPNSNIFATVADIYRVQGDLKKALSICTKGIKQHPDFTLGYISLALIYRDSQNLESAIISLKKAIKLSPKNILSYKKLGEIYLKLNNSHKALQAYKMVLLLDPKNDTIMRIIKKLEPLTAVQYDKTGFAFKSVQEIAQYITPHKLNTESASQVTTSTQTQQFINRMAIIKTLIYQKDFLKAKQFLEEMKTIYTDTISQNKLLLLEKQMPINTKNTISDNQKKIIKLRKWLNHIKSIKKQTSYQH